jgi:hypothetical protein
MPHGSKKIIDSLLDPHIDLKIRSAILCEFAFESYMIRIRIHYKFYNIIIS